MPFTTHYDFTRLSRESEIKTEHVFPPIPIRSFDWMAYDANTYDADCDQDGYFSNSPVGYGATEAEAIADLKAIMEERS